MITLSKKQIGNWVLLDYLSQKQVLEDKVALLEKKHGVSLDAFEQKIDASDTDNFQTWDDLIEWQAYSHFLSEINLKITDIRNGDFQMAG